MYPLNEFELRMTINEMLKDPELSHNDIIEFMRNPFPQELIDIMGRNILSSNPNYETLNKLLGTNITQGLKLYIIYLVLSKYLHALFSTILVQIPYFKNKTART